MSITFNFNDDSLNVRIEKKAPIYLQGNEIHKTHLKECKAHEIDTKNGKVKVIEFTFENEEGLIYSDRVFEPRSKERVANANGYLSPSDYDYFMTKMRMYSRVMAPKLFEMMNANKLPAVTGWDQLITILAKQFNNDLIGKKEFQLKLVKNKDGWACVPRFFLSINKDGEMYVSSRFIGELEEPIEFNKSELKNIKEKEAYTPTSMKDIAPTKDDVMDMISGQVITTEEAKVDSAPFGGGTSQEWESLLG